MNEIFTRRSIRKYQDKPVEQEKIDRLLRAAMQAPSAKNQQAWEFIVVNDKQKLMELSNVSPYAKMLQLAPLAFVLLGNEDQMKVPEKWQQDLAAANQNMLLEAVNLDLGAVWLGVYPDIDRVNFISNLFDLPDNIKVFSIVVVGYPDETQENKFVDRFDKSRVRYNKY